MPECSIEGLRDLERFWLPLAVIDIADVVEGSTRFQKLVFLGEIEGHLGECFAFEPNRHGPYSSDLAHQVSSYKALGYIKESLFSLSHEYGGGYRHDYKLTEEGQKFVKDSEKIESISEKRVRLEDAIKEYVNFPLNELLAYVYQAYLPNNEEIKERRLYFEYHYESVSDDWKEREDSFYPISWLSLAALEQIQEAIPLVEDLENVLDKPIILNASCDLVTSSIDLFQILVKYEYEDLEKPSDPVLHAVQTEFWDIYNFIEEYTSHRGILTPFSELKIKDIITKEEEETIKKELQHFL